MTRFRANNVSGTLAASVSSSASVITFASVPTQIPTITAPTTATIELGTGSSYEVTHVTAYAAGASTAVVQRAAEDGANWPAVSHLSGTSWALVPTAADYSPNTIGVYIPPNWGQYIAPQLITAGSSNATVALVGDSITQGFMSSNLQSTSWGALVTTALQNAYGNGGDGMFSMSNSSVFTTGGGMATTTAGYYAHTVTGNFAQLLGGTFQNNFNYGVGPYLTFPTGTTASIVAQVIGPVVTVYYANVGPNLTVNIDGTVHTAAIVPSASTAMPNALTQSIQFTGLSNTTHTVGVYQTATTTHGTQGAVCGIRGNNTTGVIVDNYGAYGSGAHFSSNTQSTTGQSVPLLTGVWMGGQANPADMVIYGSVVNDLSATLSEPITPDTYASYIRSYMQGVFDSGAGTGTGTSWTWTSFTNSPNGAPTGATDVIFLIPHFGQFDNANYGGDFVARIQGLAEQYNAMIIDMNALGRNSWSYWNSLNYWGNALNPATTGTDTVHPSDAGHRFMADTIVQAINTGLSVNQGVTNLMTLP